MPGQKKYGVKKNKVDVADALRRTVDATKFKYRMKGAE
jgi:hypothetical protein